MMLNRKIFILSIFILVCFYYSFYSAPSSELIDKKAVIVDQLSLTHPNQTFVEEAKAILEQSGYKVDYIQGEKVTIECYQKLFSSGYDIIILRAHSALYKNRTGPLSIFSAEPYDKNKYVLDQLAERVGRVCYVTDDNETEYYFAFSPAFVSTIKGFKNSTVILMGCDGLVYPDMADAFIKKGADIFIGFDGPVTASYSDAATLSFLKHYVKERLWVEKARILTFADTGSDPVYGANLWYYPPQANYKRIPDSLQ